MYVYSARGVCTMNINTEIFYSHPAFLVNQIHIILNYFTAKRSSNTEEFCKQYIYLGKIICFVDFPFICRENREMFIHLLLLFQVSVHMRCVVLFIWIIFNKSAICRAFCSHLWRNCQNRVQCNKYLENRISSASTLLLALIERTTNGKID